MKEIKIRAWNRTEQRWCSEEEIGTIYLNPLQDRYGGGKEIFLEFPDYVLLQLYTGLKDKNGVEIYEGDIVAFEYRSIYHFLDRRDHKPSSGIWIEKEVGKIKTFKGTEKVIYGRKCLIVDWQNDLTGFFPFADSPDNCGHCGGGDSPNDIEVIGNIYENPELLEEQK